MAAVRPSIREAFRSPLCAMIGVWLCAAPAPGQTPALAALHGHAYDSLAHGPLAGATVWLRDVNRSAFTDGQGRFVIDSVPAGPHVIILSDPELEDAGIPDIATALTLRSEKADDVTLATPSLTTLWRHLCEGRPIGRDSAIVFGTVRDADTDSLLDGATVTARWMGFAPEDSLRVRVSELTESSVSDRTGSYRLCGIRPGSAAHLQARAGAGVSGSIGIPSGPRLIVRQDFAVGRQAGPVSDTADGPGMVHGVVRTSAGRPVSGARVDVGLVRTARSEADGRFAIPGLPVGTQWLRVLAVGYAAGERAVDVRVPDTASVIVELRPIVILDTIAVRGQTRATRELAEFQFRRELGLGYTLDEAEIKRHPSVRSLFLAIPSVTVTGRSDREFGVTFGRCGANLFVDGIQSDFEELASYGVSEITGIEVYPSQLDAPPRFQTIGNRCGVVLVWTRRMR